MIWTVVHITPIDTIPAEFDPQFRGSLRGDWEIRGDGEGFRFVITNRIESQSYLMTLDEEPWEDVEDILEFYLTYAEKNF
jgi:hypothetical protein